MQESRPTPAAGPPRGGSDRWTRWLTIAIFAVIIVWLAGVLSALLFGVIGTPSAPRTQAEHDLLVLGSQVDSGKVTTQTYAEYIDALIRAGQLSKAQSALDQSLPATKSGKSYLLAEQAALYQASKDYPAAIIAADKAMAEADKELKAVMAKNVKNNRNKYAGAVMPVSYQTAALVKAESLLQQKKYAGAIKAYDAYLVQSPTDSDVLVERAKLKLQVGDKKGAEADFRSALKYVPDYQAALDGLKQMGVKQ